MEQNENSSLERWTIEDLNKLIRLAGKGYKPRQIASETGIPEKRVHNKLYNLRKALRVIHEDTDIHEDTKRKRSLWEIMFGASR